jgi:tetratricopeptide (TPR) repeat protein
VTADVSRRTPSQSGLPKNIGPYAIRERIGKGAMGVVYRAIDQSGKNEVALKVMASDLDGDPETRERFFREAHVAGKLKHRNIVAVRDSGDDSGRLYIAMELLCGATLNEVLKQPDAFDLEDRVDLMIQVCQGLTVAHAAGVFHRDLKPANLFVCEDRRVKILDFGVARLVGSNMTVTGNIIGTPDFMSPEQVRGEEIDGRSDIFSAGSVFYLLLTGRKPFAANDLPAVLNKVVRSQPLPIRDSEAPEAIAAVIRKAMSKDPAARQQDVSQLACELMAAASTVATTTRQTALAIRTAAGELDRLITRLRELSAALEIADKTEGDRWTLLREQYPVLRGGGAGLGAYPIRSRLAAELNDAIRNETESLAALVSQIEEGHAKYSAGKILLDKGADEQALREFEAARRAVPASPVIARAIEAVSASLQRKREQQAQLEERINLATEALNRGEWNNVLGIAKDLERVDPAHPLIARLRETATRNLELERAKETRAAATRKPTAAPATPQARGQHSSADDTTVSPPSGPAAAPPREPRTAHPETAAERTVRAARLREQATRHFNAGDLANAERVANEALQLNTADRDTRHLLERVRAALVIRTKQEENGRRIADLLKRADALADLKRFEKALALCDDALAIEPTHEGAVATRARLAEEYSAYDADREREAARQRRLRACTPALQQARLAFEAGDFERARWCAENALALAPDSTEAQELLAQITAAMPKPSDDDTVKLSDPQSDETAELAPLPLQESVHDRVRNQASGWLRQWRSPDPKTKG